MRIVDLLHEQGIDLNFAPKNKAEAIDMLVELMDKTGNLNDKDGYKEAILAREDLSTTGIGDGIAIPHGKTKAVKNASLAAAVSKEGVDYDALDGMPSHLFFMIAAPEGENEVHLEVLARLSTILMDEEFRKSLINAKDKKEFLNLIDKKEKEKFPDEQEGEAEVNADVRTGYRVLAVTACPTGIAHTYMAAESLNGKAEEMGISIKVETNGSGGAKNVLTKEDIENCEAIIVAADKKVDMARFDGKKVIQTKVADGIHKAEELISRAAKGDAPIYHHAGGGDEDEASAEKESFGRQIYKHLMNGVSHMLPFVIGGGILIALAFLFDDYNINPANFGKNTPLAAVLKTIGETSFNFMLPVLAGYISMSIADRPGLAAGFVGGALANSGITIASAFDSNISVVSGGFLGALFAGFLAGYLVLGIKKVLSFLPQSL